MTANTTLEAKYPARHNWSLAFRIQQSLADGNQIDTILLDCSKAFAKVPHQRLIHRFNYYGIRDKNLNWIKYFLGNRQPQVLLNGITSSKLSVDSGVPQVTVLGPTLLLLFIGDLPEHLNCNVRLFSDDCVLYRNVKNQSDSEQLQKDLTTLQNWEKT